LNESTGILLSLLQDRYVANLRSGLKNFHFFSNFAGFSVDHPTRAYVPEAGRFHEVDVSVVRDS
jgi:hypothetical protein